MPGGGKRASGSFGGTARGRGVGTVLKNCEGERAAPQKVRNDIWYKVPLRHVPEGVAEELTEKVPSI